MIEKIQKLLLQKGADDVIVSQIDADMAHIKFVNNKVVKTAAETLMSIGIFVAKDSRLASTSIRDPDEKRIKKVVDQLMGFIDKTEKSDTYVGIADGKFKHKNVEDSYDRKVIDSDIADLVNKGINISLNEGAKRTAGEIEISDSKTRLINSNGVDVEDKKSNIYYSIRALIGDNSSGHMTSSSCVLGKLDVEGASKKAGHLASLSKNPIEGKPGKYNIVFDPMAFASLLNTIADAASIFSVESGMSYLNGKLGEKLGDFDLVDDGVLANGLSSGKFDAEGRPAQTTKVIDNGVLKTYLHNTSSASRHKVEPTGNAGIISPGPTNTVLDGKKGDVFDVKNGLYISNVWYTRFQNYASGDFSTIPRDGMFLIKDGEIGQPVKNLRVSDNMLNIMRNIVLFGKKKVQIRSWEAEMPCLLSEVLIKDVNVTKPNL